MAARSRHHDVEDCIVSGTLPFVLYTDMDHGSWIMVPAPWVLAGQHRPERDLANRLVATLRNQVCERGTACCKDRDEDTDEHQNAGIGHVTAACVCGPMTEYQVQDEGGYTVVKFARLIIWQICILIKKRATSMLDRARHPDLSCIFM